MSLVWGTKTSMMQLRTWELKIRLQKSARYFGYIILRFSPCYLQDCEEETRKQLEYILDQLRSPDTSEESSIISDDESDDIIDEDIDIEEEIDESDPVLARNDEMSGFVLLEQKYFSIPIILLKEVINHTYC